MPIRYRIHPESRAVLARCSDPVDLEQLCAYTHSLGRDSAYEPGLRELIDMRGVSRFDIDASILGPTSAPTFYDSTECVRLERTAYVADDPLVLEKLDVYRGVGRELADEIALFNAMHSALAWVGVPADCEEIFLELDAAL